MANEFPPDEFDQLDESDRRVGAHRARKLPGRGWITLAACIVAAALLIGAGWGGLQILRAGNQFDWSDIPFASDDVDDSVEASESVAATTAEATPTPTPTAVVDLATPVVVLNGTTTAGLAARLQAALSEAGWTEVTTGNSTATVTSVVYYTSEDQSASAAAVAEALQIGAVELDPIADGGILVIVGTDYN